jgi:hypothetical protein
MHEQRGPDRIALVDGSGEVLVPVGLLLGFGGPVSVRHEYGRLGEAEPGSALYRIRAAGGLDTSAARKRDLPAGRLDVREHALPADVVVTVLARPRRRGMLVTLARRDGAISLDPPDDWAARVQAGLWRSGSCGCILRARRPGARRGRCWPPADRRLSGVAECGPAKPHRSWTGYATGIRRMPKSLWVLPMPEIAVTAAGAISLSVNVNNWGSELASVTRQATTALAMLRRPSTSTPLTSAPSRT